MNGKRYAHFQKYNKTVVHGPRWRTDGETKFRRALWQVQKERMRRVAISLLILVTAFNTWFVWTAEELPILNVISLCICLHEFFSVLTETRPLLVRFLDGCGKIKHLLQR